MTYTDEVMTQDSASGAGDVDSVISVVADSVDNVVVDGTVVRVMSSIEHWYTGYNSRRLVNERP